MGIQDRDYMRERHRKTFDDLVGSRRPPVKRRAKEPSTLAIILFWLAAGFILYRVYGGWLHHREERQAAQARALASAEQARRAAAGFQQPPAAQPAPAETPRLRVPPLKEPAAPRQPELAAVAPARVEAPPRQEARVETSGTIYLCRAYNGGTFWAQAHCGTHQALIETIASVPPGLPFEQQVHVAEQQRRPATTPTDYNVAPPSGAPDPAISRKAECEALDARVEHLDALARQPQSGQTQDWIRVRRQEVRDRQFAMHC